MTATRIIFSDDVALTVSADLDNVQESVYNALENGGWMVIRPGEGPAVSINPRKILYMEELNQAAAEDQNHRRRQSEHAAGAR